MAAREPASETILSPRTVDEAREMVSETAPLAFRGGGTKWGLADPAPAARVMDVRGLSGIVDYDPSEFTITARAGTPLAELVAELARHGQYLPFDPPFVASGATLGGAIASGISGPCRLRWGGVRDFVLGVRFIDGLGRLVRGGGRVVKNAAGFDFPKLLCGSRGRLGLVVEATLKVFPAPRALGTLVLVFGDLPAALVALRAVARSPLQPVALDLVALAHPPGEGEPPRPVGVGEGPRAPCALLVRGEGPPGALEGWMGRVEAVAGVSGWRLAGEGERLLWDQLRDLRWADGAAALIRVHTVPSALASVERQLERLGAYRHYSVGGNVAWVAVEREPNWDVLGRSLAELGTPAVVVRGAPPGRCWICAPAGEAFARRVKQALDPYGRFGEL